MIESIVIEEYERLLKLVELYQCNISGYPKRRGKRYLHLQWREGHKVHTK